MGEIAQLVQEPRDGDRSCPQDSHHGVPHRLPPVGEESPEEVGAQNEEEEEDSSRDPANQGRIPRGGVGLRNTWHTVVYLNDWRLR